MSTGAEYRYVYDDLGQLKREDNTVTGKTYIYEYDDAGNITSKKTYTLTAAGVTPSGQPSTSSYGYNDSWGDLLTSYNGVTISYDAIGNPLSYYNGSSYTFTWKNGRQLATASVNSNTLSFNYNDEGIRTSKTVNGVVHTYHLSGSDIIAEEWGNNLIIYLYDSDGSPMGMQYRTSSMDADEFYTFWFEKNLQGDIVAVYNSAGIKVISYSYDAWGNCITTHHNVSGTNSYASFNPFRYRGYYYDSELGFYYLNSRYYDPAVGRFINADALISTGQGLLGHNMFAYCYNNPILYFDIGGNEPDEPDWASSYTTEELRIILEIGYDDFFALPYETQCDLLGIEIPGQTSSGYDEDQTLDDMLEYIPHDTYVKKQEALRGKSKIVTSPIWIGMPVLKQARSTLILTEEVLIGIQAKDKAKIYVAVGKYALSLLPIGINFAKKRLNIPFPRQTYFNYDYLYE